jgi:hypothetical protein
VDARRAPARICVAHSLDEVLDSWLVSGRPGRRDRHRKRLRPGHGQDEKVTGDRVAYIGGHSVAPGLLEGTRATANLHPEQIERSATGSLLKRPADKDDCADMVSRCAAPTR